MTALAAARDQCLPEDFRRGTLYASSQVHSSVAKAMRIVMAGEPDLTVVAFRWRSAAADLRQEDAITTNLASYLCDSLDVLIHTTTIQDRLFVRLAILNLRTTPPVIKALLDGIRAFVRLREVSIQ